MKIEGAVQRNFGTDYEPVSSLSFVGRLQQIDFAGYRLLLDLEGRIKWIIPLSAALWPGPSGALRRTIGNRWILYDSGSYQGVFELTGRYYFPAPFNMAAHPFANTDGSWLREVLSIMDRAALEFGFPDSTALELQALSLRTLLEGSIPVLPPDTIHVDYDVIPLLLTRGCLHNCSFCQVKGAGDLEVVEGRRLKAQVDAVTRFMGKDLVNYSSIFLGQSDALAAGPELLLEMASLAYTQLDARRIFMFGSVDSFLEFCEEDGSDALSEISSLGIEIYLNIGIESIDQDTLDILGKPIRAKEANRTLRQGINLTRKIRGLHVSFNFMLANRLPAAHMESLVSVLSGNYSGARCRVYLSPLIGEKWHPGELKRKIFALKAVSRLPLLCYFIVPFL